MSGFAPIRRAAPALLLATSNITMAQGPAAPILIGTPAALTAKAYSNADYVASPLLAGEMSRLAAVSAQQGGVIPVPAAPGVIINSQRINGFLGKLPGWQLQGIRLILEQPTISYRQPDIMPAFMRGMTPNHPAPSLQPAVFNPTTPLPRSGQPDVFGSVALPVSRTSLDSKWAGISQPIWGNGPWGGIIKTARAMDRQQQIELINSWVNRRLRFVDDRQGGDNWASASQSLRRGAGDCEDYAIAKMKLLEAAGFDPRAMFLVIARDLVRQADHAVLAVRMDRELLILDNMTDRALPSSSVSDYRPIMSFNAYGRWTHGYRVAPKQPVQFAAR